MKLKKGSEKKTVEENIAMLVAAGWPKRRAVETAIEHAAASIEVTFEVEETGEEGKEGKEGKEGNPVNGAVEKEAKAKGRKKTTPSKAKGKKKAK